MRKPSAATLAALSVLVVAVAALGSSLATANPPGVTDVGKKIANFNIIAVPNEWVADDSLCPNNGARMFFRRGVTPWTIIWTANPDVQQFNIRDCDGTTDKTAIVDQNVGANVAIFVRVVGPQGSKLTICQDVFPLVGAPGCLLGTFPLEKNKTFTKITEHLFDTAFAGLLWTLDPSTNFRIAQVDVYALPAS